MSRGNDLIIIEEVELLHQTPKAYLVRQRGMKAKVWVPKSECTMTYCGLYYELEIPEWLADEKGFEV